jgi:histidinol dehydrogenase
MKRLATRDPGFESAFRALLDEARETTAKVDAPVAAIIAEVRARGDAALLDLTARFDRWTPRDAAALRVTPAEIAAAVASIPAGQRDALAIAARRIEAFHRAQLPRDIELAEPGLATGMRWGALDAVGLYVPGGKAAYPSSVLMNALPARVAGVGRIAICVPTPDGALNPLVLAAAHLAGVTEIHRVGGAQAVAALAYGTAGIAPVEVIADAANDPRHVALDLLAQAEHDEAAQSILITDDAAFAARVEAAVAAELRSLPRAAIAGASWAAHGAVILVRGWEEAAEVTNRLAPEHLQIMLPEPRALLAKIRHAGAAFLGRWCPEAVGDYVAGPNHVLPTGRTARFASGLSVFDFLKRTTWVEADRAGLAAIGPAAVALAEAEGLHAHGHSIAVRLDA